MKHSVVIGCGGHSRAVLNVLIQKEDSDSIRLYDLNPPRLNETVLGIKVVGNVVDFLSEPIEPDLDIYLAIGDNSRRQKWFEELNTHGYIPKNLVADTAEISSDVRMGVGNFICPLTFIGPQSVIGSNTIINTSAIVEHEVQIGDACHMAPGCKIAGRVKIANNVFVGVGANLVDKISICDDVIIGAGAAVIKSINMPGTYVGVPAKKIDIE